MSNGVMDRVLKLMRLATNNTYPEEARTSAMRAVELIQEHRLLEGAGRGAERTLDVLRLRERLLVLTTHNERLKTEISRLESEVAALRAAKPPSKPSPPTEQMTWRQIRARFPSSCVVCGRPWDEGERIVWARGKGARCLSCGPG